MIVYSEQVGLNRQHPEPRKSHFFRGERYLVYAYKNIAKRESGHGI